jgi:hypothetical protein
VIVDDHISLGAVRLVAIEVAGSIENTLPERDRARASARALSSSHVHVSGVDQIQLLVRTV